jgi:dTMP kinase
LQRKRNFVPGTFITFEGIDGSGKSTQLRLLSSFLRVNGCDIVVTREPGGTPLGLRLRAALLDSQEQVDPLTELLVFAADRAQHVRRLLRPALESDRIVLSDRYADATVAYQGAGRGFSPELISEIVALATEGLKPDLTLLFDVSVTECTRRTGRRSSDKQRSDRLDAEDAEFHTRVRDAYLHIAAAEPDRVRVVDSSGPVDETHARVKEIVVPFLESRGCHLTAPDAHQLAVTMKSKTGHC